MFHLKHQSGSVFTFSSSAQSEGFASFSAKILGPETVNLSSSTLDFTHPGNFLTGEYRIYVYGLEGDFRYLIDEGRLSVSPNPDDLDDSYDVRSQNERILDAINSVLEGRASRVEASYSIDGKALTLMSIGELLRAQQIFKSRVASERGVGRFPQNIVFRM
ncbi:hypothetical protein DF3PA_70120 [Candidatus Defluviicoccus seviourii]|uniref:Uncharacterized protein n=1 Tax=Candidatus Defluviicoccus seviourii TaxID=2565273 RepID=A0A564WI89_9PROT|nr:hypothetical protein DF3PA_70120 [Candidatus Defluviicoccus seviourii]